MGIDIDMSVGIGIHVSNEDLMAWGKQFDPNEGDIYGELEDIVYGNEYPGLTMANPNNSWTDHEAYARGIVILISRSENFDMGREAQAGVYRPGATTITLAERGSLNGIAREITGRELPIEPLVTVGVS